MQYGIKSNSESLFVFREEFAPRTDYDVDVPVGPVRADGRLERLVHERLHGVEVQHPLREELHLQHRVLPDEPLRILRLVAGGVVCEECNLLHLPPPGVPDDVGQVGLVPPAPPLGVGVEDERALLLPEERDETCFSSGCSLV